ncbi:hypothetical protein CTAYLR_006841 [Chrysophaeum taylorii]|uniref:PPPDE domain-containing protein n=1 Tax=Chrysophaeum taylorii TaxID=2483200 RepID=A0AAD7U556_9STRA|nr:hypothetical protein CTAYLR_006841 [Chrysophaeum taylorii]
MSSRRRSEIPSSLPRRRLDLRVLRGRVLVSKDANLVTAAASAPYCQVVLDDEEIGATPVVHGTPDPVWTWGNAFDNLDVSPASVITVRVADRDVISADQPMGEVRIVVGDWIAERAGRDQPPSPNTWRDVEPTNGGARSGELELRLVLDTEKVRPHGECGAGDPRKVLRDDGAKPPSMKRLTTAALPDDDDHPASLVEFVWGKSEQAVCDRIAKATTPVFLHVYDVGHSSWIANLNRTTEAVFGGVFHGGLEVHGREFSFGGCQQAKKCGIFPCRPRKCVLHTYRETIYLGDCQLGRSHVSNILRNMRDDWPGRTYDMLRKNCCHFCREFAIELGVGDIIPTWTNRLANVGAALTAALGGPNAVTDDRADGEDPRFNDDQIDAQAAVEKKNSEEIQGHLLEHVMADRIQIIVRQRSERSKMLLLKRQETAEQQQSPSNPPTSPETTAHPDRATPGGAATDDHHNYIHLV